MTTNVLQGISPNSGWLDAVCRRLLAARLGALVGGGLTIHDAAGSMRLGSEPFVDVRIRDPRFYRRILRGGTLGAGESYVASGDWDCDDLVGLIRLLARNRAATDGLEGGAARLTGWIARFAHVLLRDNNPRGSRRNIAAHYDLGNALFERMLDSRMQYSSAMYEANDDLESASRRKLDRIVAKLELSLSDHLLEIGSGWGGLAIHAARESGCRVTTTTVSREQYEYTRARVAEAGLEDRTEVLCNDYRELSGRFSKLVSVEMVEAVGANHLMAYSAQSTDYSTTTGLRYCRRSRSKTVATPKPCARSTSSSSTCFPAASFPASRRCCRLPHA